MAVASTRQTEALASVIFFVFSVSFFVKHPKYLGREFNHGHCLSHNFFLAMALHSPLLHKDIKTQIQKMSLYTIDVNRTNEKERRQKCQNV